MRLIDADELRKCAIPCEIHNGASTDLCIPLYQIDNAPTIEMPKALGMVDENGNIKIELIRPQGEWIVHEEYSCVFEFKICSNCGESAEWLDGGSQLLSKFCPNCGAKMKKGGNT